jgi:hypothetical protein
MQALIAIVLFLATPEKGTICFGNECTATASLAFDVKPADVERRFVWTSGDGSRVVLGKLAAKATSVDVAATEARTVSIQSLRGDPQRGWPLEARFAIVETKDSLWRWSVPAKMVVKPLSIRLPRGTYSLLIAAEHHKSERRPLKVVADDVVLREVTLAPLPVATGRVVTMKRDKDEGAPKQVPVGAQLARSDGKVLTATNEQGAFRAELTEPLSPELVITAPGFGMRVVPLHVFSTDTDLGAIELGAGVKLTVHVHRPESLGTKTLRALLTEQSRTVYENTKIAERELKAGEDDLVFADLSEGEYYLALSGEGTLERLTTIIPVKTEDVSKEIRIAPFQLAGSVHFGDDPVREGTVEVVDRQHTWRAQAAIDGDGHFGGTMWQSDSIGGWVSSKATGSLPVDGEVHLSGDPAMWDIRFRKRLITGRLFDEETKQPITAAGLDFQLEAREVAYMES